MKKHVIIIGLLLAVAFSMSSCGDNEKTLMDVPVISDYVQFDYSSLKNEAKIIAKVQVVDNLSTENTQLIYDPYEETQKSIIGFVGMRKVKILELYKGTIFQVGETMEIIEPAGVTETQLLHDEGYQSMAKDGIYIVFLNNETASGKYGIISASNGIVDLNNPGYSKYLDIEVKTIVEYESDIPEHSKAKILVSKITQASGTDEQYLQDSGMFSVNDVNGKEIYNYVIKYGSNQTQNTTYVKFVRLE